jgi:hypothetical protein
MALQRTHSATALPPSSRRNASTDRPFSSDPTSDRDAHFVDGNVSYADLFPPTNFLAAMHEGAMARANDTKPEAGAFDPELASMAEVVTPTVHKDRPKRDPRPFDPELASMAEVVTPTVHKDRPKRDPRPFDPELACIAGEVTPKVHNDRPKWDPRAADATSVVVNDN